MEILSAISDWTWVEILTALAILLIVAFAFAGSGLGVLTSQILDEDEEEVEPRYSVGDLCVYCEHGNLVIPEKGGPREMSYAAESQLPLTLECPYCKTAYRGFGGFKMC